MWHNIQNQDKPWWQSRMNNPKTQATCAVSLECPLLFATSVGLRCVYCATCCLCLWNVHSWLPPRLVFIVYIVPNVVCVFGMSIINCHLGWSSLWILGHMLPVSLECPLLFATSVGLRCVYCAKCCLCLWYVHYWLPPRLVFVNGHSKDTGNIWHSIHNDDQPRWQSIMDIPKTQATFGTVYTTKTNRGGNQ
jgi:hypothetical protein